MTDPPPIVELIAPQRRRGFLGLGGTAADVPAARPDAELLLIGRADDGTPRLERVTPQSRAAGRVARDGPFARVRTAAQPLGLSFAAVVTDGESHAWDLVLTGSWAVRDPVAFLTNWALRAASPTVPVEAAVVESWMASRIRARVIDAVRGKGIEYLRDEEGLPPPWWEKRLGEWLGPDGIGAAVVAARWASADAARAVAEQRGLEELDRMARAGQQQRAAELREAQAKADYQRQRERIEADSGLSQAEQAHRRHLAELQYRREVLVTEAQVEDARRSAEQAAIRHQLVVARLNNDLNATRTAAGRQAEAEDRHARVSTTLTSTRRTLEGLNAVPGDLLGQLTGRDVAAAFQAAERLTSPEFGLSPRDLAVLGFPVGRQVLVGLLNDKSQSDARQVVLTKQELQTRDIGAAKVKALPIGSSLQFELLSRRPGYLALLNIGTSSATSVHVPTALVPPERARVQPGRTYAIPGPELFPWDGDYREEGPPGWEHLAAVVSDQILIHPGLVGRSSADSPIVTLSDPELESLVTELLRRPPDRWSAAVLSFLVAR